MNIIVIHVKKILNVWFLEMSVLLVRHVTTKKSKKSCPHAPSTVKAAMVKRLRRLLRHHLVVDVRLPVVRAVVTDGKNTQNRNPRQQTRTLAGKLG
jgi:hypothetical protein